MEPTPPPIQTPPVQPNPPEGAVIVLPPIAPILSVPNLTPAPTPTEGSDILHGVTPGPSVISATGMFSLALIFVASGVATLTYLENNTTIPTQAAAQTAQAAAVSLPIAVNPVAFASTTLQADAAYVLDIKTNQILYSHNADVQLPLASITKVPMAMVVSEVLTPDMHIVIPRDTSYEGDPERLAQGDTWRIGDVIDLTLAASSNSGAEILSEEADESLRAKYPLASGSSATLWRMNDLAKQLGLSKTYFLNVSGLDESTTQSGAYGSARDVAVFFAYAASTSPKLFAATTQPSFSLMSLNGAKARAVNTDRALDAIPAMIMGKTGYTDLAGGNLAVVFEPTPGHPVVAVVLGSTEQGRFDDMKKLVAATKATIR